MSKKPLPDTFKDIIGGSLPGSLARRLPPYELGRTWRALVGDAIGKRSRPVALEDGGVLVVAVKGGVWRQELSFLIPQLLDSLREKGYNLSQIKLVLDRTRPKSEPPPPPLPLLDPDEEAEVQASVASVKDPRLREDLAALKRAQLQARKGGHK